MSEFTIHRSEDGDIEPCDCCGCKVPTDLFGKPWHLVSKEGQRKSVSDATKREDQYLYCEVCSTTLISSVHGYPAQYYEDGHILKCMAQCTNMILEAIRGGKQ